ncbi:MAG: GDSL-type esterase/lipase family protein [Pseudonocardiaceae bacterium]
MRRLLRTTAVLIGATSATVGAAYGMLSQQGRRAHRDILIPGWFPFRADGVYLPDGTGPYPPSTPAGEVLRFAVPGDSSAAGLGVERPEQLPGVVLSRGLAQRAGRAVQLDTLAICGCTSRRLSDQVDAVLIDPPQAVMIMIDANDVARRLPPWESAKLLGEAVSRLRTAGAAVVVGTCPDLGAVRSILQPLRALARAVSLGTGPAAARRGTPGRRPARAAVRCAGPRVADPTRRAVQPGPLPPVSCRLLRRLLGAAARTVLSA